MIVPHNRQHRQILAGLKHRAKRLGVPFDLTLEDVVSLPSECPCCEQRMERGGDKRTSPSMDRLLPEAGYTRANTIWVCLRCNQIKSDATLGEIYRVADFYYEELRRRGIPCVTANRPTGYKSKAASLTSPNRIEGDDE